MARQKKQHPVEIRDAEILRDAVRWQINVFLGVGRYVRAHAETFDAAQGEAQRLEAAHPGKRAMIYGINAAGRAALWTQQECEMELQLPKAYTAHKNAVRAMRGAGDPAALEIITEGPARFVLQHKAPPKPGSIAAPKGEDWAATTFTIDELTALLAIITRSPPRQFKTLALVRPLVAEAAAKHGVTIKDAREMIAKAKTVITKPITVYGAAKKEGAKPAAKKPAATPKPAAKKDDKPAKAAASGKRAAAEDAARGGKLPEAPDFSAETHARYRGKLAELIALAKAGDVKGLKAFPINPNSTSPKALDRYRNLAVIAIEARK